MRNDLLLKSISLRRELNMEILEKTGHKPRPITIRGLIELKKRKLENLALPTNWEIDVQAHIRWRMMFIKYLESLKRTEEMEKQILNHKIMYDKALEISEYLIQEQKQDLEEDTEDGLYYDEFE